MDIYSLLSLTASEISIILGIIVFYLNRKSTVHRLFMCTMFVNAYWAFCTFMKTTAQTANTAFLWAKVLSFWPLLIPLMLHFTLAYTESNLLKNKLTYVLLYVPALLISTVDLTTNLISGNVVLKPWGYITVLPETSFIAALGTVWSVSLGALTVYFYLQYLGQIVDKTKRRQIEFVAFGFIAPILLAMVTDSVFPALNINFPGLGSISGSITALFVLYAMARYKLFSFRPEIAAENIFSTMPDSIILVTLEGKIVKVNQSLLALTGYDEKDILGASVYDLIRDGKVVNQQQAQPKILECLRHEREIKNYEIIFQNKMGNRKVGVLSCSMVTDNQGNDVGAAFVLHDVTDSKEMEQKLLKAERYASIGELAGMLGHDLRNPLSGIRGATFYLRRKLHAKLDKEDIAMFDSIDKSIDYSNKIITDLLDYASYYSSEVKLELTAVTPKMLLKDALALTPQPQNVSVVDETLDVPSFCVDEVKICRSFINILKNAFDAMPNGGEVHVASIVADDKVIFTFRDNGCGMSEETIAKLWTPLFTTKAKGMGFGMVICKRNIEAHGGKIGLNSILGQGTTITVELPTNLKNPA